MCIKAKKTKQLGMNPSTASNRLKKLLLFDLAKRLKINWCYQCGAEIKRAILLVIMQPLGRERVHHVRQRQPIEKDVGVMVVKSLE
jgi:hypothetical protein